MGKQKVYCARLDDENIEICSFGEGTFIYFVGKKIGRVVESDGVFVKFTIDEENIVKAVENKEQRLLDLIQVLAEGVKTLLDREEARAATLPKSDFINVKLKALRKAIKETK